MATRKQSLDKAIKESVELSKLAEAKPAATPKRQPKTPTGGAARVASDKAKKAAKAAASAQAAKVRSGQTPEQLDAARLAKLVQGMKNLKVASKPKPTGKPAFRKIGGRTVPLPESSSGVPRMLKYAKETKKAAAKPKFIGGEKPAPKPPVTPKPKPMTFDEARSIALNSLKNNVAIPQEAHEALGATGLAGVHALHAAYSKLGRQQ